MVLLLVAIMGLSITGITTIYATNDSTCHSDKICNFTGKTIIKPDFYHDSFYDEHLGYSHELHIMAGQCIWCTAEFFSLEKNGKWKALSGGSVKIAVSIYNSHNKVVWNLNTYAGSSEYMQFRLPRLGSGNYTIHFAYNGNEKSHLQPCTTDIPFYIHQNST